jgi:hypothetical protein
MPRRVPPEVRFWNFVNKKGPISPRIGTRCWIWTGATFVNKGGKRYGAFTVKFPKTVRAHRYAYELRYGSPGKLHVHHECRMSLCVRWSHLDKVTPKEHAKRDPQMNDFERRKTHCPQGQDLKCPPRTADLRVYRLHPRGWH